MMEAEVGMMQGHKPRNAGGFEKVKKARKRFSSEPPEGMQPCQPILDF